MPQYREARKAIANLQAAKDEFRGKIELQRSQQAQQSQIIQQSVEALRRAIPNFETRQQELSDFAVNELGMSEQEIAYMTSPVFHGPMATKLVFAMNKLYEKVHAPATADKKLKKASPQPTMRSGSGNTGKVSSKPAALKSKAMQTGSSEDWAAYIQSIS